MNDRGMNMADLDRHITGGGEAGISAEPYVYNDAKGLQLRKGKATAYVYGYVKDESDTSDAASVTLHIDAISSHIKQRFTTDEARQLADMLEGAADLAEGLAVPEDDE